MNRWYAGRPALVLGGLGFIGANLSRSLLDSESRLTIVTQSRGGHAESAALFESRGARIVEADIRHASAVRRTVRNQDVIFNLAGQSGAVPSMDDPWTDLDVNCRGNLTVLEALRTEAPPAKLVFVSTRLVYGAGGNAAVSEEHPTDPLCVHAVHKLAAEQYLRLYAHVYGVRYAVARLTNPYGPGQPADRTAYGVVNRLIHQALAGETLPIYGDGRQRRDYIYIDDAVDALLRMGESRASDGRTYNVGSGTGTPLIEMARSIVAIAGSGRVESVPWPPLARQIETGDFVADVARMRTELGWEPHVLLADGLQRTVAHHRAHVA